MVENMKKFILLSLLATLCMAKNPDLYAVLGDVVYNNTAKIQRLKAIDEYSVLNSVIDDYLHDVEKTKEIGFKIDSDDKTLSKKEYLNNIRKLSKRNDFFIREVYKTYRKALADENSWVFHQMINSGLMNLHKHRDDIIEYYMTHSDVMETKGAIEQCFSENEKLKIEQKARMIKLGLSQNNARRSRIQRLRRNDKLKQEAIKKSLEDEVAHEKTKIRQEQVEKLSQ
jgi:hypothetical protein